MLLFFRFTYHISKTPIPLEKVEWGISVKKLYIIYNDIILRS